MAFPTPKRITELDLASPLTDADQIAIVQGTRTKRATIAQVKTSTDTSCQCTLVSRYNTVGTDANTLEKFFQTYQMPADTLSTDGSWLEIMAWGSFGSNNVTKVVKFYFGSSSFNVSNTNSSNQNWHISAKAIRSTSTTQKIHVSIKCNTTTAITNDVAQLLNGSENTGIDIPIAVSGTNGNSTANDVTCEGFIIRVNYMDANS